MQTNYVLRLIIINFNWEGNLTSWNVILTSPEGLKKCTSIRQQILFPTTSPSVHSFDHDFAFCPLTFSFITALSINCVKVNNTKAKPKKREARSLSAGTDGSTKTVLSTINSGETSPAYSQHSAKSRVADLTPQLTFSGGGSAASRRARLVPFRSARGHLARRGGQAELRWWEVLTNQLNSTATTMRLGGNLHREW